MRLAPRSRWRSAYLLEQNGGSPPAQADGDHDGGPIQNTSEKPRAEAISRPRAFGGRSTGMAHPLQGLELHARLGSVSISLICVSPTTHSVALDSALIRYWRSCEVSGST